MERFEMAAVAACFSASEDAAVAASLACSTSEGSRGSCLGSSSGGCEAVEDEIGADCRFVVVVVPEFIEAAAAVADRVCVGWRACMAAVVVVICIAAADCAACCTGIDPAAAIAWIV